MSELINNRTKQQEILKEIILELHAGKSVDEVKGKFKSLVKSVGPGEIAQLENALMQEGIKEEEIQRLCDVHLSIFEDSLILPEEESRTTDHPLEVFKNENKAISALTEKLKKVLSSELNPQAIAEWKQLQEDLKQIDDHYQKKEHLLFPYLEKKGVYGPPSVMWATHDEIRDKLKIVAKALDENTEDIVFLKKIAEETALPVLKQIDDMVNKEEKVLFPLVSEKFLDEDWQGIKQSMPDFGYTLIEEPVEFKKAEQDAASITSEGYVNLGSGSLSIEELSVLLNSLPIDITFVDKNREVRYFTEGKERFFPRPRTVIGRKVEKCHPPESVHIVDRIIGEMENGKRDTADFWINLKGQLLFIRYLAARSPSGEFLGVIEVTQNITDIQKITGEKRLLDDR